MDAGRSMRAVKGNLATPPVRDEKNYEMLVRRAQLGEERLESLLCSRNARSRTPLVERAQWETNQAPSTKQRTSKLGRDN
jgi:hypothetical protein